MAVGTCRDRSSVDLSLNEIQHEPPPSYGGIQYEDGSPNLQSQPSIGLEEDFDVQDFLAAPNLSGRYAVAASSIFSTAAAVGLLACVALGNFGKEFNATAGVGFGFFSFFSLVILMPKSIGNAVKDRLLQFAPFAYFYVTNTDLNIPVHKHFFSHLTAGILLTLLGSQLSAQLHNITNWGIEDDFASQEDAQIELLTPAQIRHIPIQNDHRIPVFTSQKVTFGDIELKAAHVRCIQLLFQGILGVGVLVAGYTTSAAITLAAVKTGTLILGSAVGGLLHEGIRSGTRYYEREGPPSPGLSFFRLVGKAEMVAGALLVGLVGMNKTYITFLAACCFGIKRQIEWIRFTRTPVTKLTELRFRDSDHMRSTCKLACLAALAAIWLGFYGWQMAVGPTSEQVALSTYTWMAFLWGAAASLIDRKYDILNGENRLLNTFFFYLRFSIAPPIYFIGITQVMQIGSEALIGYAFLQNVLACIAWADLGSAFGSLAATMITKRNTKYPANLNSLFAIYVYYFSQLVFGVASTEAAE